MEDEQLDIARQVMAEDREALSRMQMADALDRQIILDALEELWNVVAYGNDPDLPYDEDDVLDLIYEMENEQ